jgi:hypothetical protein
MENYKQLSPEELRQHMAQIRASSHVDVETIMTGLRQNLDWRYHLQRHPWAFAGAAALLGYWLIPKGKARAQIDAATVKQLAAELHIPLEKAEKRGFLQQWVVPLALKWGSSGALQVAQLLLTRIMAKSGAKEAAEEEVEETSFIPPHRPR